MNSCAQIFDPPGSIEGDETNVDSDDEDDRDELDVVYNHMLTCTGPPPADIRRVALYNSKCSNLLLANHLKIVNQNTQQEIDKLLSNDYDRKYIYYVQNIKRSTLDLIQNLIRLHGNEFFDCYITSNNCCQRRNPGEHISPWQICIPCENGNQRKIECPYNREDTINNIVRGDVRFVFRRNEASKFYQKLGELTGLLENDIEFSIMHAGPNPNCMCSGCCTGPGTFKSTEWSGFPMIKSDYQPFNPKSNIPKIKENSDGYKATYFNIYAQDIQEMGNLVQASSLGVFFAQDTIKQMNDIIVKADEMSKEERHQEIMTWINMGLMVLSLGGGLIIQAARSLALAFHAASLTGQIAMTTYEAITAKDGRERLQAIMFGFVGIVFDGVDAIKMAKSGISKSINAKAKLSPDELDAFPPNVRNNAKTIDNLVLTKCVWK